MTYSQTNAASRERWEYARMFINPSDEYRTDPDGLIPGSVRSFVEAANLLGAQGWELVQATSDYAGIHFKRKIQ